MSVINVTPNPTPFSTPIMPTFTPSPIPTPTPISAYTIVSRFFIDNYFLIMGLCILALILIIMYYILKKVLFKRQKKDMLFKDFNVGRFKIVMYRKIGDKYHEIDRLKMDIKDKVFKYNNKDFKTFNINDIAFSDKNFNYYAFDYDTGEQLKFNTKKMPKSISVEDVDIYVNRGIIEQLVKGLEDLKPKGQWLMLIVGAILGVGIGIIIGMYAIPKPTVAPTPISTPIPTPIIKFVDLLVIKLGVIFK